MQKLLIIITLSAGLIAPALAGVPREIRAEILDRCATQMGRYGAVLVKMCVDQDLAAVAALDAYPPEHRVTILRCGRDMRRYGFVLVKSCADQDIAAAKALADY
jgi:hypothetical protein